MTESPKHLTAVGDTLFFTADDGVHGRELWKSDGSRRGTALVKDIDPDDDDYYGGPDSLSAVGDTLFFTADDGVHGRELWKSDGTTAGTVLVKDIDRPEQQRPRLERPILLDRRGEQALLRRQRWESRHELWKSDGSKAGTVLVKDIDPGADADSPAQRP